MNFYVEVESTPIKNIFAQQIVFASFLQYLLQPGLQIQVLTPQVDKSASGANGCAT